MVETTSLTVMTPTGEGMTYNYSYAVFPSEHGQLGVLPNHSATVAKLSPGVVALKDGNEKEAYFFVAEGFVHVKPETTLVLTPFIEKADDIDVTRAEAARDRAQERLSSADDTVNTQRARRSLSRAEARLYLASL